MAYSRKEQKRKYEGGGKSWDIKDEKFKAMANINKY